LLAQLLTIFGFSSVVLVLVYWVNRAVRLFDWLIASGQSATVFLEFTALTLPNVIRLVLPISAFVSAVYVTNRLSSESELVVVQATGYSPWRLARAVLIFGAIVALFVSILVHLIVPLSLARLSDRQVEVSENITARLLVEGQFLHPADGLTFFIGEISAAGELRDIYLRDGRDDTDDVTYTATRAALLRTDTGPKLVLIDGLAQVMLGDDRRLAVTGFNELTIDLAGILDRSGISDRINLRELSTPELFNPTPETLAAARASVAEMTVEGHQRFTQALMSVAAPLLGFATLLLGGFSRFGIWNQIFAAVGIIIVLQVLDNALVDVTLGTPALWPLVYLPSLGGLVLAYVFLFLAGNPQLYRRQRRTAP
jgi:lipopolysaccharide export system permease protein